MFLDDFCEVCVKFPDKSALILKQNDRSITEVTFDVINNTKNTIVRWLQSLVDDETLIGLDDTKTAILPSLVVTILELSKVFYFVNSTHQLRINVKYLLTYCDQVTNSNWSQKSSLIVENQCLFLFENRDFKPIEFDLQDILFVIETSGTTSDKKTVRVSSESILTNVYNLRDLFEVNEHDVIFFNTPLTFDPSIIELFLCLITGASLLVIEKELSLIPNEVFNTIFPSEKTKCAISIYQTTPSNLLLFPYDKIKEIFFGLPGRNLKVLALGGEPFPETVSNFAKTNRNRFRLFNLYGLTEISCWISYYEFIGSNHNHNNCDCIGQFFDKSTFYEIAQSGELLIGHEKRICLLNNEKWSDLPDKVLRPTGDLFEIDADEKLIFKGRNDFVIKRFGVKLSLNVLEKMISEILNLPSELVICNWNPAKSLLILFVNLKNFRAKDESKIIDKMFVKLLNNLESFQMINEIKLLRQFPLTENAKIDRTFLEEHFRNSKKSIEDIFLKYFTFDYNLVLNKTFKEIGCSSFMMVQIVNELMLYFDDEEPVNYLLSKMLQNDMTIREIFQYCSQRKCNEAVTRVTCDTTKKSMFKEKWKCDLNSCVDATPAICIHPEFGPVILIGSFSYQFAAILVETGKLLWKKSLDNSIENTATISICNTVLYVGTDSGTMYCLAVSNGNELWTFKAKDKIRSKAVFIESNLVFGSYDHFVYCLNHFDGSLVWKKCLKAPISADFCLANDKILLGTLQGEFFCLTVDGGLCLWKLQLSSPIFSSAMVAMNLCNEEIIIMGEVDGTINVIDFSGRKLADKKLDGNIFGSILSINIQWFICGTSKGYLYCLDNQDLSIRYFVKLQSGICKTPQLFNSNEMVIALVSGTICILSIENGSVLDEYTVDNDIYSEPIVLNDGVIAFGSRDNYVHCIQRYFTWGRVSATGENVVLDTESSTAQETNNGDGRNVFNIVKRISNLLVFKNDNDLQPYEETSLKQYWMPDSTSRECYECNSKFTTFRRKHHCRLCGQIFCSNCCYIEIPGRVFGCSGLLKVCSYCCKVILTYLQSPNVVSNLTADLKSLQEELLCKFENINQSSEITPVQTTAILENFAVPENSEYLEDIFPSRRSIQYNEKLLVLDLSEANLRNLYEDICNPFTGLPFHLQRYQSQIYVGCFLGSELVDWLLIKNKAETRASAVRIGEALYKLRLIDNISDHHDFYDSCALYKPCIVKENVASHSLGDDLKHEEPIWSREIPNDCSIMDSDFEAIQCSSSPQLTDVVDLKSNNKALPEFNSLELFPISGIKSIENDCEKSDLIAMNDLYMDHELSILKQEMSDKNLTIRWIEILLPIIYKLVENFELSKYAEIVSCDVRHYIQFKKMFSSDNDIRCDIFNGFACSKNIAHSRMANVIENPKILLLQCPLVFDRNGSKFISLETVRLQEEEYLKQLVAKMVAMKPDLILVYKLVSRFVQELLISCGITVVGNMKMSVLNRLSRCMKCTILSSVDTVINKPRLGTCKKFYTQTIYFDKDQTRKKTIMFFEGLPIPNLGCTVFLRGPSYCELQKVKDVAKFILFTTYNNDLEESYNREILAKLLRSSTHNEADNCLDDQKTVEFQRFKLFKSILNNRILSMSPLVRFSRPYFEYDESKKCKLYPFSPNNIYNTLLLDESCKLENEGNQAIDFPVKKFINRSVIPTNDFIVVKFTGSIYSDTNQMMIALFRAKGCQYQTSAKETESNLEPKIEQNQPNKCTDIFNIKNHQKLEVLFCCYCLSSTNSLGFCINPWVVSMEFYGQGDISLGLFLDKYCFRPNFNCLTAGCEMPMIQHVRRFVHGTGCISVSLSQIDGKFDQIIDDNAIVTWNWCKDCKTISPMVPISEKTWFLSFAKFLELKFYAHDLCKQGSGTCQHLLHVDHYQYFRLKNIVACFKYDCITILEICLPEELIKIDLDEKKKELEMIDEVKALSLNGHEIYSSILEKLISMVTDNDFLTSLKNQLQKDQNNFKIMIEEAHFNLTLPVNQNVIDEVYRKFRTTENAIVKIKKSIITSVEVWNSRLVDIEKKRREPSSNSESNSFSDGYDLKMGSEFEADNNRFRANKKAQDDLCPDTSSKKEPDKNRVKTILSQFLSSNQTLSIIQSPFSPSEHHMLPAGELVSLSIYESEPISIVAFALNSSEYKESYHELLNQKSSSTPSSMTDTTSNEDPTKEKSPHIEVQFEHSNCNFFCRIYFADKFSLLRKRVMSFDEEAFITSISRSIFWNARGGKSGSNFAKTKDERFIIKDLPRTELELFLKSAEKYFDYFEHKFNEEKGIPTILAKIVGVYHVIYQNLTTNSSLRTTFFVMENLFYNQNISQKFDLKGSIRNRLINPRNQDGEIVFLDENFIKMSCESPLYVYSHSKDILTAAIENDTKFLMELSVIDYSLLVGLDSTKNELFVGIIDYIRTFTWSKKLETIVKKSGLLGGQGRAPTIVSPEEYRERFLKAMHLYFLEVPDHWTSLRNETKTQISVKDLS